MGFDDLTVAIMAGGKSSRMGVNKSFVALGGKRMIDRVLERTAHLASERIVVTNTPKLYEGLGLPMFADLYPNDGPLAGIFTAVTRSTTPYTLIVATDMPWLNADLLQYMATLRGEADIIVPKWQQYPEPMHAIYSKAVLPFVEANLKAKRLKITQFFHNVSVRYVERAEIERYDKHGRSFANINTPEELAQAQQEKK